MEKTRRITRSLLDENELEDETTARLLKSFVCSKCLQKRPSFEKSTDDDEICKYCSGEYVDPCKDCLGEDCICCENRDSSKRRRFSR